MDTRPNLEQIATFGGECSCGWPNIVEDAKKGILDGLLRPAS